MKFSEFSKYLEKLESTSGRIEMTQILAELFKKCSVEEIDKVTYLLLGDLAPLFASVQFNIASKIMIKILANAFNDDEPIDEVKKLFKQTGDLGIVAMQLAKRRTAITPKTPIGSKTGPAESWEKLKRRGELSVVKIFEKLYEIAITSGSGSQEKKIKLFSELLSQVDPLSAKYLVRIPLGKMRLGLADKTLIEALSFLGKGDKTMKGEIEKFYFVYPDIGTIAKEFKKGGINALKKIKLEIGVPVLPELCQRIGTAEEIIEKMGNVAVEPKFDGTRVQLHFSRKKKWEKLEQGEFDFGKVKQKGFVKTFTRNLEDTTHMFPEIVEAAFAQIEATEAILDGEAVGYDVKTEKFLPFQITIQRKRKYGVKEKAVEIPLKYFVFDILFKDGKDLLNKPFSERRKTLEEVLKKGETIIITPQDIICEPKELSGLLVEAISKGLEGVVVKKVDEAYEPGARGFSWVKFKREEKGELADTIDCVVLGYYTGEGKRAGFEIGKFLVGVYNLDKDCFESISKIGTGLTDEQWQEMKRRCDEIKTDEQPKRARVHKNLEPDFWVRPVMVVEILADEITRSPIHTAGARGDEPGYALRFPRLIRWRDDKSAEVATTVKEIRRLYKLQRKR